MRDKLLMALAIGGGACVGLLFVGSTLAINKALTTKESPPINAAPPR